MIELVTKHLFFIIISLVLHAGVSLEKSDSSWL